MARRPGLKTIPISKIEKILHRERGSQWDLYLPLSGMKVEIKDSLAPLKERFQVCVDRGHYPSPVSISTTAMSQLSSMAGVPANFLDKVPASLGLKLIRCMLEMAAAGRDNKTYLVRFRKHKRSTMIRAILPQGFVRLNDTDILADVASLPCGQDCLKVTNLNVNDDMFSIRIVLPDEFNLGTERKPDPVYSGIDILSSETGRYPLEIRNVLFRALCSNGMTSIAEAQERIKTRYTKFDRENFKHAVREAMNSAVKHGYDQSSRLRDTRSKYIKNPLSEVEQVFHVFKLGSPRGSRGRWIINELLSHSTLFGVTQFDIVQAFTAVARDLDHSTRLRFEDSMGAYIMKGLSLN